MKKHINIPIFIPHLGCPNQCVFCNQHTITGAEFHAETVRTQIEEALLTVNKETEAEIAFFGGSFTGIDRALMIELLEIANSYIISGRVKAIRCSTRPDYIDQEVLDILKQYNVGVIELGLQSTDNNVLSLCKRGHDFESEKKACELILENGFQLVGQMMIGLPGSDAETERATADFIVKSGAVGTRIYPTVVFNDTELCHMARVGRYSPLTEREAIVRSADVFKIFKDNGIDVIRIGLCSSENLSDEATYFAGPNHPALGELVESEFYYKIIMDKLSYADKSVEMHIRICCACGELSKVVGHKKINKQRIQSLFPALQISIKESSELEKYELSIYIEEGKVNVFKVS